MLKGFQISSLVKKAEALAKVRNASNDVSQNDIKREIDIYKKLASVYDGMVSKSEPYANLFAQENLRMAATLGDLEAKYKLGKSFVERGKFWDSLKEQVYSATIHSKYAREAYEEGFAYLNSSLEQGYFMAGRYLGLCHINGWGVEINIEHGFGLIINSIQDEGAWEKATEIFQELGLNKPEFFKYMMKSKG